MRLGPRVVGLAGLVLVLSGIPAASSAQDASSTAAGGFIGYQAAATGMAVSAFPTLPALLPVKVPVEATISLATATLSSGGQGFGRASTFFPGTLTAGLRPLLQTGAGVSLPIPDYPIVVESREFEPAKHAEIPGVTMTSDVVPARADATADAGALDVPAVVSVHSMRTESLSTLASTTITATSTTTVSGVSIGGMISIGSIVSTASVSSDGTHSTCSGGVTISGVSVAGTPATLDDSGLHVANNAVVPGLGIGPLVQGALAGHGITARTLAGDSSCSTANGSRTTAGVLVSVPLPAISTVPAGGGLSLVLGSTSASAGASILPPSPPTPSTSGSPDVTLPFTSVPSPTESSLLALPGPLPADSGTNVARGAEALSPAPVAAFAYNGVPLSLLIGLALLALVASGRVRRYMDRIMNVLGP